MSDAVGFGFFQNAMIPGSKGVARLKRSLESPYAIRFNLDSSGLGGYVGFQVAELDGRRRERSFYEWGIGRSSQGKLTVTPLTYQPDQGREMQFQTKRQPKDSNGIVKVEMIQTEDLFRVYVDDELVLYVPSLFFGGVFGINLKDNVGADYCHIRDFQVFSIKKDPGCPTEAQYRLPVSPSIPPSQASPEPVMKITRERLEALIRYHTAGMIAQVFGTDEKTVNRYLDEYQLEAMVVQPAPFKARQPKSRLTAQEIEKQRKKNIRIVILLKRLEIK